jgi:3',5'-cyclic AMP phosphodiesterase CpdA
MIKENYPEHGLIVTGDITDDGAALQFENAYKALEPFKGKVYIAPGNHDFAAAGNLYSEERAHCFDTMLSIRLQQGGTFAAFNSPVVNVVKDASGAAMLIALDTNLETPLLFTGARGKVGDEQLTLLGRVLSDASSADCAKLLFFHHHPFIHSQPGMFLVDADDLFNTIYGRVDVLLFGHKHTTGQWSNVNGIKHILASDNSPGKDWVREISIEGKQITVSDVSLKQGGKSKSKTKKPNTP